MDLGAENLGMIKKTFTTKSNGHYSVVQGPKEESYSLKTTKRLW